MTTVAWDGTTLAVDRRATVGSFAYTASKAHKIKRPGFASEIVAWSGSQETGLALAKWYEFGMDMTLWPKRDQDSESWSRLIVVTVSGIVAYESLPIDVQNLEPFMAWGTGRDFAMGALACGKTAREAVEVACRFDIYSGNGSEEFTLDE